MTLSLLVCTLYCSILRLLIECWFCRFVLVILSVVFGVCGAFSCLSYILISLQLRLLFHWSWFPLPGLGSAPALALVRSRSPELFPELSLELFLRLSLECSLEFSLGICLGFSPELSPGLSPGFSPELFPELSPGFPPGLSPELFPELSPELFPARSLGIFPAPFPRRLPGDVHSGVVYSHKGVHSPGVWFSPEIWLA